MSRYVQFERPWKRRKPLVVGALLLVWAVLLGLAVRGAISVLWPLLFVNLVIGVASLHFRGDRNPKTLEIE